MELEDIEVLLLFETTGLAALPFEARGFKTACVDLASPAKAEGRLSITADVLEFEQTQAGRLSSCKLIFGFPPCDDLAVCGAAHFSKKRKRDPEFQEKAVHLARSVERIGQRTGIAWALENPISCLSTLWRKPNYKFDPYHYGGYLTEDDQHPYWPKYIAPRDAYPKRTCLWTGNGFKMPKRMPVKPEPGYSRQHRWLGGKAAFTKKVRAASPRGFFTALAKDLQEARG